MNDRASAKPANGNGGIVEGPQMRALHPLLKLALEMGPLVVFFLANQRAGIFMATALFMVAVLVSLAVSYALTRHLPMMPMVTGVVVLVFGGLTLWLQDELFIKLKPTIVNSLFGATLLGGLAFGTAASALCARHGVPAHAGGLAEAHVPLGPVLLRARRAQRDRLAHADDGFLGQLQGVRHHADDASRSRWRRRR